METTGRVKNVTRDWDSNKLIVSFEIDTIPNDMRALMDCRLDITADKHRNKRSKNANALLWKCLSDIAASLKTDKWAVYLEMLKRYGEFTYICVKPAAVENLKKQWRECEEIGSIDINGRPAVQMLCYYGSHTYDTKQFARLLDGVISEMSEMGLETPTSEEMRRSLEQWEKMHGQRKAG